MHDETPTGDTFNQLLVEMPRISDAVNTFASEQCQRAALDALLRTFGVPDVEPTGMAAATPTLSVVPPLVTERVPDVENVDGTGEPDAGAKPNGRPKTAARKPSTKKNPRAKDINPRPEGKQSLRDFFAEKQPSNFYEKNLVFVYYLEEFLDVEEVDIPHVLGAYAAIPEKAPTDPENSLLKTASSKKWLDTSNLKAIKTTHLGREMVKYDMPVVKKNNKTA